MKKLLLILTCIFNIFLSLTVFANVELPNVYLDFSKKAVESYFRNRDTREENNLSIYFSDEMLRLLNMKIDLIRFQNEKLNRDYSFYNLEIVLVDEKPIEFTNGRYSFELQIIRKMQYSYVDNLITTISTTMEIEVGRDEKGNLKIYESFENFTPFELPDIDSVYREEMKNNSNLDLWAEKFLNDTKKESLKQIEEIKLDGLRSDKKETRGKSIYLERNCIENKDLDSFFSSDFKGTILKFFESIFKIFKEILIPFL